MSESYDTIIIGAGIAGASIAHALGQKDQSVLMIDKAGIAKGGSGAAGAFVSPKIGKASSLHALTNEAFEFSQDFYSHYCPEHFHQTGMFRIPQNPEDMLRFPLYEKANTVAYEPYSSEALHREGIKSPFAAFFFPEAGDCDAVEVCEYLLKAQQIVQMDVQEIAYHQGLWSVGRYQAKNLILATGYESELVDVRYMGISGVWGSRGDFRTQLRLGKGMHQSMSISANTEGIVKLGATHERQVKSPQPCENSDAIMLKEMAESLVDTQTFKLQKTYCGMRAGSRDYAPLLGKIIDVGAMLHTYPHLKKGGTTALKYHENLYIYNGLGGRGFVFAPFLAKMLAENIVDQKEIDPRVNPDRLFFKWCRKLS